MSIMNGDQSIIAVRAVRPYILAVAVSDREPVEVDVEHELCGEIFEPLREPARFAEGSFDPLIGTIVWPTGADFSPEFLITAVRAALLGRRLTRI